MSREPHLAIGGCNPAKMQKLRKGFSKIRRVLGTSGSSFPQPKVGEGGTYTNWRHLPDNSLYTDNDYTLRTLEVPFRTFEDFF